MPRQRICARFPDDPFETSVGWSDGSFQIGVTVNRGDLNVNNPDQTSMLKSMYGDPVILEDIYHQLVNEGVITPKKDDEPPLIGAKILDAVDRASGPHMGIWTSLDRQGCNDLIRFARTGRDRAFGKDQ